jgi:hypothetical protein
MRRFSRLRARWIGCCTLIRKQHFNVLDIPMALLTQQAWRTSTRSVDEPELAAEYLRQPRC